MPKGVRVPGTLSQTVDPADGFMNAGTLNVER